MTRKNFVFDLFSYENNQTDKRVPAKVEQKIDALNKRNKIRKQEMEDAEMQKERSRSSNTQVTGFTNATYQE